MAAADGAPSGTPVKPTSMLVVGATGTLGRQVRARSPVELGLALHIFNQALGAAPPEYLT